MLKKIFITSAFVFGMAPFAAHASSCSDCQNGCNCEQSCECDSNCDCPDC